MSATSEKKSHFTSIRKRTLTAVPGNFFVPSKVNAKTTRGNFWEGDKVYKTIRMPNKKKCWKTFVKPNKIIANGEKVKENGRMKNKFYKSNINKYYTPYNVIHAFFVPYETVLICV